MEIIPKKFRPIYDRINQVTFGLPGILIRAISRFIENRGAKAAASISYYTIFSVFPLLILVITATSYFIEPAKALQLLTTISKESSIPLETILNQMEKLNPPRNVFSLIGLAGFLWASSGVFETLALNLDLAWGSDKRRSFIVRRLVAFAMVISLVGIALVTIVFTTVLELLSSRGFVILGEIQAILPGYIRLGVSFALRLLFVWSIYRLVPAAQVKGMPAFWSALLVSTAWGIVTAGFSLYLKSGFSKYDIIYGSLGAVIVFLTWVYLGAWIFLFGAYLAEAIQNRQPG